MDNKKWYEKIAELFSQTYQRVCNKLSNTLKPQESSDTMRSHSETKEKSILGSPDAALAKARKKREILNKILKRDEQYSEKSKINIFKRRKKPRSFFLQTVLTCLKLLLVVIFMLGAGVFGGVVGLAEASIETAPSLNIEKISDQDVNSYMYDSDGNLVTTFKGTQNREWAKLSEIPEKLQQAVIAIEDIRFYYHDGVDVKRLFGAVANNFLSETVQGGSTLTQQLVKNRVLTIEQTYKRKIQEAYLAFQLEKEYSKEDILEAYINTNPLGGMNYGVKAAAKDYFGKDLSELTLRECAMLAGIPQSPYKYDPRRAYYETKDTKPLNDRTDLVLKRMYQADFITKEEYEAALKDEVHIIVESTAKLQYPHIYFVEYCIDNVIENLLYSRGKNPPYTSEDWNAVENELRTSGYSIYMTMDTKIQTTVEKALADFTYPKIANEDSLIKNGDLARNENGDIVTVEQSSDGNVTKIKQPQSAAVVYDHHTGEVKALAGGRETPKGYKTLNRAVSMSRPGAINPNNEVGSSIKPLAVYGPAIDMGLSPGSPVANIPVPIKDWYKDGKETYPRTSTGTYGSVSLRRGLTGSLNIATARTLNELMGGDASLQPKDRWKQSAQYLKLMGIPEGHIIEGGSGLALGNSPITPLEMAGAYGTIANEGTYLTPLAFTKVTDKDGNVILDANSIRERRQAFKPSTAYMLTSMLVDAVTVKGATGTNAHIAGMTVGGKTGTVQGSKGLFFAGITPYYTATVWIGPDKSMTLSGSNDNDAAAAGFAAPLWKSFMSEILKDLPDKPIIETKPSNIVEETVCSVSGMLTTDACLNDTSHKPNKDMFLTGTVPTQYCTMHKELQICQVSNKAATPFCLESGINTISVVLPETTSVYSKWLDDKGYLKINGSFSIYKFDDLGKVFSSEDAYSDPEYAGMFCPYHNPTVGTAERKNAVSNALAAINRANGYLRDNENQLSESESHAIRNAINALQDAVADISVSEQTINQLCDALNNLVERPPAEEMPE